MIEAGPQPYNAMGVVPPTALHRFAFHLNQIRIVSPTPRSLLRLSSAAPLRLHRSVVRASENRIR
jgi:hypothetical protein